LPAGVAPGAGFAGLETMGYAFVSLVQSDGNLRAVDGSCCSGRAEPRGHMAWTGLTAAAPWYAAQHRWRMPAVLRFVAVYAVAVTLHTGLGLDRHLRGLRRDRRDQPGLAHGQTNQYLSGLRE
jgi:RsiW-degrading membrane proteinase PrsW (M82 family)